MTKSNRPLITGLAIALVALGVAASLGGIVATQLETQPPDRTHAATTATLDGDTLRVHLTAMNEASKVTVRVADGYPVDPFAETLVGTFSPESRGDGSGIVPVEFDAGSTVIVRSHAPSGEILITNVYRRHAATGTVVDMYANYTVFHSTRGASVSLALERVNNSSYRVTWVRPTPGFQSATHSEMFTPGVGRADEVLFRHDEMNSSDEYLRLSAIGDSTTIRYRTQTNEWNETVPTRWVVYATWNGTRYDATVLSESSVTACGLADDEFDTYGEPFAPEHCRTTHNNDD